MGETVNVTGYARAAMLRGAVAFLLGGSGQAVLAAGGGPTGCIAICPGWPNPSGGICRPTSNVDVIPGSSIECGDKRVELTQGSLAIEDGSFTLNAKSLLVSGGQSIQATCDSVGKPGGFMVRVGEFISVGSNGRMDATCTIGGGKIVLNAGSTITVTGQGIKAKGLSGSNGGSVHLRAVGNVVVQSALEADSVNEGGGEGGDIEIRGENVTIAQTLSARGAGAGGFISASAAGDLTINAGGKLNATGAGGEGGEVSLSADGDLYIDRRIEVLGAQASDGEGGLVSISGESVEIRNEIIASGGILGGQVHIESRGGVIDVGSQAASAFAINVTRSSPNPGDGGVIEIHARGNDVIIGSNAKIDASGSGTDSEGGTIHIAAATVTAESGSEIAADSTVAGTGGTIRVEAGDLTNISGSVHANNGGEITLVYRETPPSPPVSGATVEQDPRLPAPCGDGILRAGSSEQCDATDFGGATCQSVNGSSGSLGCTATCLFDTSDCN